MSRWKAAAAAGSSTLNQHQDFFHGPRWNIEVDVPARVALIANDLAVPQYAVVQDRQAAGVLVSDHPGELCVGDHVELEADVLDGVASTSIASGHYDSTVVVESKLVFEAVPQARLVKGHMGFDQFEVERDEEPAAIRSCNGLVGGNVRAVSRADTKLGRVSVGSGVDALILRVLPLPTGLPEVLIAVIDVAIIDRQGLVYADPDSHFLLDGTTDILDQRPVGVGRCQRDCERQSRGSGGDYIIRPQIREPNEELLILVNA